MEGNTLTENQGFLRMVRVVRNGLWAVIVLVAFGVSQGTAGWKGFESGVALLTGGCLGWWRGLRGQRKEFLYKVRLPGGRPREVIGVDCGRSVIELGEEEEAE